MTRKTTISMRDRADEIRTQEIAPREAELDEVLEEAEAYDDPWDIPDELEARHQRLKESLKRLRGEASTLDHYADEWAGDEFVIRELSVGGVGMIQDDVAEASGADMRGGGTPKQGYARQRTLEVGIVESPAGAPEIENIADKVADWLFDCIDEFNSTGEVRLGNSSLRSELMTKRKQDKMQSES